MLDNSLSPPKKPERSEAGRVRRAVGRPRRRLLQQPQVPHRTEGRAAAGKPALVEVGGLHDLALGDGAPRAHLLVRRELVSDRPERAGAVAPRPPWPSASRSSPAAGSSTISCAASSPATRTVLAGAMLALVMASAWALFHVFGARAAFVHVGAMIGTMMVGNVFFHIIPGQKTDGRRHPCGPRARPDAGGRSASSDRCTTPTSRCPCCS